MLSLVQYFSLHHHFTEVLYWPEIIGIKTSKQSPPGENAIANQSPDFQNGIQKIVWSMHNKMFSGDLSNRDISIIVIPTSSRAKTVQGQKAKFEHLTQTSSSFGAEKIQDCKKIWYLDKMWNIFHRNNRFKQFYNTSPGEERGNEMGKVVIAHGSSVEFWEATPIGLADESKESLYGRETDRDLRSADLRST